MFVDERIVTQTENGKLILFLRTPPLKSMNNISAVSFSFCGTKLAYIIDLCKTGR
jgi:hypothetical protein